MAGQIKHATRLDLGGGQAGVRVEFLTEDNSGEVVTRVLRISSDPTTKRAIAELIDSSQRTTAQLADFSVNPQPSSALLSAASWGEPNPLFMATEQPLDLLQASSNLLGL